MRSKLILMLLFGGIAPVCAVRSQDADSLRKEKIYPIGKVVVTCPKCGKKRVVKT